MSRSTSQVIAQRRPTELTTGSCRISLLAILLIPFACTTWADVYPRLDSEARAQALKDAATASDFVVSGVLLSVEIPEGRRILKTEISDVFAGDASPGDTVAFAWYGSLGPWGVGDTLFWFLKHDADGGTFAASRLSDRVYGDSVIVTNPPGRSIRSSFVDSLHGICTATQTPALFDSAEYVVSGVVDSVAQATGSEYGILYMHASSTSIPPGLSENLTIRIPRLPFLNIDPDYTFETGDSIVALFQGGQTTDLVLTSSLSGVWRLDNGTARLVAGNSSIGSLVLRTASAEAME